ncbi:MAG: hypothetical protein ACJ74H_05170 [Thermoanaerobaculia bacterium]
MLRIESWLSPKRKALAVFLGAALFSLPGAVRLAQRIIELAPLPYEERRARELGELYTSLRAIEKTLPPGDVNVLLLGPNAIDRAIFINYHLYPRASHLYTAAPGRPLLVTEATGPVRRTIVKELRASADARRELIVPIVTASQSGDGYATEAIIEGDTRVTLTLMPSGAMKTYVVRAREPLIFSDIVHESFGVMTTGWLRVRAEQPVRAGFWFVNRARAVAAPVPAIAQIPVTHRLAGGEKLWVLNPGAAAVTVRVNGREEVIDAGALRQFGAQAMNEVEGSVVAFTSAKMPDGNTRFGW